MRLTPSDTTVALRAGIKTALDAAYKPLTSSEIVAHPSIASLNVARADAVLAVAHTYLLKSRGYPMLRVPAGKNTFAYFNPDVVKVGTDVMAVAQQPGVRAREDGVRTSVPSVPVSAVNPGEFGFNPIEFGQEVGTARVTKPAGRKPGTKNRANTTQSVTSYPIAPPEQASAAVQVPAGVKCITLSVAGVSIKIELG